MSEQRSSPDVLARRLDQALPSGKTFIPPTTPDPLVNTAAELAKLKLPTLSPQRSARIEAQMLAAFDTVYPAVSPQTTPRVLPKPKARWPMTVLRYGLVASLVLAVLVMSLTPSVYASVPGEPLYAVKQFYENVALTTAATAPAKTAVYLNHAQRRADEAITLLDRHQYDSSLVEAALQNVDTAAATSTDTIRSSPQLRSEVLVIGVKLNFVMAEARYGGLTTADQAAQLDQQIADVQNSDLLVALPPSDNTPQIEAGATDEAMTESPTPDAEETQTSTDPGAQATADCAAHGKSCDSQGVPSGNVIPGTPQGHPTHQPTNTPRPANPNQAGGAKPTPRPANVPPSSSGGSGNGNSSGGSGGNSNSSSSGGGSGGNSNSGGNGNGNGKGG